MEEALSRLPEELEDFVKACYAQDETIKKVSEKNATIFLNKLEYLLQIKEKIKRKLPTKYYKYIKTFFL